MAIDGAAIAEAAGLRYVYDSMPGYTRRRAGRGFLYLDERRRPIRDEEVLARIRRLAIPPAWTQVWICPSARGHIQATGRDARGRKQYRYHERWRETCDETKFHRMVEFGLALPRIRRAVQADLARDGLPKERVVAAVVGLLDRTFMRVGNDEYARDNGSYGLTTLRDRHVRFPTSSRMRFEFVGKAGKRFALDVEHPRFARVVRRCRDLPGYRLFQYIGEDGEQRALESDDVNEYLRRVTEKEFSAKDFRTWAGTVLFARAAHDVGPARSKRDAAQKLNLAVRAVSEVLGNTPAVCRSGYIHPALIQAYADGELHELWDACARSRRSGLRHDEAVTLAMLKRLARRAAMQRPRSPAAAARGSRRAA